MGKKIENGDYIVVNKSGIRCKIHDLTVKHWGSMGKTVQVELLTDSEQPEGAQVPVGCTFGSVGRIPISILQEGVTRIPDDEVAAIQKRFQERLEEVERRAEASRDAYEANEKAIAERQIERLSEPEPEASDEPPPRPQGMSDEEYYDSDAYYNWKQSQRD